MLPGSHRWAPISKRFVRNRSNIGTTFEDNSGAKFPQGLETVEEPKEEGKVYVAAPVPAGALVLIHGNLLHKSETNTSERSRIAYTFHVIEGEGRVYDERNWLRKPRDGFTRI